MRTFVLFACTAALALAAADQVTGQFERTLRVSGPVELDVMTDSGGIHVRQGGSGAVSVTAILKSQRHTDWAAAERRIRALEANPPIEQSGNVIRIGRVRDPDLLRGISMRLEIVTPEATRLKATADSGGVHVAGIHGPIECQTDSGGIEATNIGADVRASVDSGGIRLSDIRGSVTATADSGGIQAFNVAGAVEAQTDSGGIRVSQTVAAPIRVRADSGGANIKLAPNGGYDVDAGSDSGRVAVPEMTVRGTFSKRHVQGKVRGGGPLVDVKVDSGQVVIE
jgi:hypothetical protein